MLGSISQKLCQIFIYHDQYFSGLYISGFIHICQFSLVLWQLYIFDLFHQFGKDLWPKERRYYQVTSTIVFVLFAYKFWYVMDIKFLVTADKKKNVCQPCMIFDIKTSIQFDACAGFIEENACQKQQWQLERKVIHFHTKLRLHVSWNSISLESCKEIDFVFQSI